MERLFYLIVIILFSCDDPQITPMKASRIFATFLTSEVSTPWYLAGGLIPESTNYIVYDPLSAADLASSYSNLANPGTNNATPGVAPTFSSGWVFNGSTQYIDARASFSASKTLVIWMEDVSSGVYLAGDSKLLVRPYLSATPTVSRLTLTSNLDLTGETASGILALRASSVVYRNTKKVTGKILGAFPAGTNYNIFIGARNNSGTPAQYAAGKVYRYALYDIVLSDAQVEGLLSAMVSDVNPSASSYEATMIASNPIVYFPCNQSVGKFFIDRVGVGSAAASYGSSFTLGSGPTGKGNAFFGDGSNFMIMQDEWPTTEGLNWDEASVAFWVKNVNANVQARPCNAWANSVTEYFAPEIRNGNLAIYFKENGSTWNTGALFTTPNNTWCHVVCYNSKSQGIAGAYLNGVKYEVSRPGGLGFANGVSNQGYPYLVQSMTGGMSHIAFYDHALTQAEVNAIYQ